MKIFKSYCQINNKKIIIKDISALNNFIQENEGKEFSIEIKRKQRSNDQNAYYWGTVIEMIRKDLGCESWEKE